MRDPGILLRVRALTTAELYRELGGRRQVEAALRAGTWRREVRGAYVPGNAPHTLGVRAAAVSRVLPPGALLADRCLLWVLGVDVVPPGPPQVEAVIEVSCTLPRRAGLTVRRVSLLPAGDRCTIRELPCLRPARAAADLLRTLPAQEALVVADAVQHAGLVTRDALGAELALGQRGVRQAREVLAMSSPLAESPPESRVRFGLVRAGLDPVPQHVVFDARGRFLARVDLAFPELRIAIEYDGREVHLAGDAFIRERRRQNALVQAGWTVLRFTAADLRVPGYVEAQVWAAVRASSGQLLYAR